MRPAALTMALALLGGIGTAAAEPVVLDQTRLDSVTAAGTGWNGSFGSKNIGVGNTGSGNIGIWNSGYKNIGVGNSGYGNIGIKNGFFMNGGPV